MVWSRTFSIFASVIDPRYGVRVKTQILTFSCTEERRPAGKEGWKKVVVCIVSDGRKKIHSRSLSVLAAMGVYQDGVAKNVGMCPVSVICHSY